MLPGLFKKDVVPRVGCSKKLHHIWRIRHASTSIWRIRATWIFVPYSHKYAFSSISLGVLSCYLSAYLICILQMMWAADFDESIAFHLGENCPEILVIQIPKESEAESGEEIVENNNNDSKDDSPPKHGSGERTISENNGMKLSLARPFCGLTRNIWSKNNGMPSFNMVSSARSSIDELPVFCVAAILFMNHRKILKETRSIDDLIKAGVSNLTSTVLYTDRRF